MIRSKLERAADEADRETIEKKLLLEERKRSKLCNEYLDAKDQIERDRLRLIDEAKKRLELSYETEVLFSVSFSVV
jgi:hypothetical protein